MRLLIVDIDTLRADHLGCYGYHRRTSRTIDSLAADGVRFANAYASDVPCGPSRTALATGRFGTVNGVVGHGGSAGDLRPEGPGRGFGWSWAGAAFATRLRRAGLSTTTISSFPARHSAYQWLVGWKEWLDPGLLGLESAHDVEPLALDWLARRGRSDDWVLHVHLWDPHAPYRAPASVGDPFADEPLPAWLTEDVRAAQWRLPGPHSAQETQGFELDEWGMADLLPRQPLALPDMDAVHRVVDGYDTGIAVADACVDRLIDALDGLGVLDETAVWITADHGEAFGELGVWCDHQAADEATAHIPGVLRWPGIQPRVVDGLVYHLDVAATVVELAGGRPSRTWDGASLADALGAGSDGGADAQLTTSGRDHLVLTQGAWTAQRGVRTRDSLYLRTWHDGFHAWPTEQLFDLRTDPHETTDLCGERPEEVAQARDLLAVWTEAQVSAGGDDPLERVLDEGGPWHAKGHLPAYLDRLDATGRGEFARWLADRPEPVGALPT